MTEQLTQSHRMTLENQWVLHLPMSALPGFSFAVLFTAVLFSRNVFMGVLSWYNQWRWNLEDPFNTNPAEFTSIPRFSVNRSPTNNKIHERLLRIDT